MNLKITIITICFNNLQELIKTCESVDTQSNKPFEHWIINGSTQGEIENYLFTHPQPSYRKTLNEKDEGIADAFNKGVIRAKGEILNMLNAGDAYFDEQVLSEVSKIFTQNTSLQWMHAKYRFKRSNKWIILGKPFDSEKLYRGMRSICHQTIFVKKSLHSKYGLYNTSLKYAMDYDFICRISNESFYFNKKILVNMYPDGISNFRYLDVLKEIDSVHQKYFGKSIKLTIWQLRLKFLYYLLNTKLGKFLFRIKKWLHLENL